MPRSQGENVELVVFNGVRFHRYPDSHNWADRAYFTPNIHDRQSGVGRLHQETWEAAHGPIPEGHDIHHRDNNPLNNTLENLECLTEAEHAAYHALNLSDAERERRRKQADTMRPLAAEWHGTEEGIAWHRENGKACWENREPTTHTCEHCGKSYESLSRRESNRFCSNACKSAARRASGVDDETRSCARCGVAFTCNHYSKIRFCSRSCAIR